MQCGLHLASQRLYRRFRRRFVISRQVFNEAPEARLQRDPVAFLGIPLSDQTMAVFVVRSAVDAAQQDMRRQDIQRVAQLGGDILGLFERPFDSGSPLAVAQNGKWQRHDLLTVEYRFRLVSEHACSRQGRSVIGIETLNA